MFEIRSASSYEMSDGSAEGSRGSKDLESVIMDNDEISETIK